MLSNDLVVSRRRVLSGGAALALLTVAASACHHAPTPPAVDDLQTQLQAARQDAELATAAAGAVGPELAPALTVVAAERSAHAQALAAEITRVSGSTTSAPTATSTSPSAQATPAPPVSEVISALHASADSAAKLAAAASGYRAGLLGSIAAACTAAYTVALVTGGNPTMTSTEPPHSSTTADDPADAALADALSAEYGIIYGYGIVSAHSTLAVNDLVVDSMSQHRDRRDQAVTMLTARSVSVPVAAAGYQLPIPVTSDTDAARLAVRMENDAAVAWRAVLEQGKTDQDRAFAVTALTQSAVLAARWNQVLGSWPITVAFPGGSET